VTQSGTGDATTIQAGVDMASAGDTVLVAPGTYTDTLLVTIQGEQKVANVHLTEDIALIAQGDTTNTIISGPQSDVAIFVEGVGSAGLIEGFRINTRFTPFGCADAASVVRERPPVLAQASERLVGIRCENSTLTIRRCALESHGIVAEFYASPATVVECLIGWSLDGIRFHSGSDALIERNRIYQIGQAFECNASAPSIVDNDVGGDGQMCTAVDCNTDGDAYIARNTFRDIRPETIIVGPAAPIIEANLFINGSTAVFVSSGLRVPIVRRNVMYDHGSWVIEVDTSAPLIEGNTIDLAPDKRGIVSQGGSPVIRNNIISRVWRGIDCVLGATPVIECNNIFMTQQPYSGDCLNQTGINGNISVDPQLCGAWDSMNYMLQSDSPCAPGNHPDGYDCGQIGAKGVGCSTVPVQNTSWGALKAIFENKEERK
jgi:hypothetical protein